MLIYSSILLMSTFFALSSSSFFVVWAAMEFSILALLPLLVSFKNASANESMLKYFLIQISAGLIFLGLAVSPISLNFLMAFPLLLKLGIFPFYLWVPHIYSGLSFIPIAILSTVQKFPPLIVFSHLTFPFTTLVSVITIMIGALGGLLLSNFKKILAFSSINHSGWLLVISCFSSGWLFYLILYSCLVLMNLFFLNKLNFKSLSQWANNSSPTNMITFWVLIMSLAGLPPLAGFALKWLSLSILAPFWSLILFPLLISFSLTLFFYLNMFLVSTLPMSSYGPNRAPGTFSSTLILNLSGLLIFLILI